MDSAILSNVRDVLSTLHFQAIPASVSALSDASTPVLVLGSVGIAGLSVTAYVASIFAGNYIQTWTSPMRILPGPKRESLMEGSFVSAHESDSHRLLESWIGTYGRTIRYFSIFGSQRMVTIDTKAINHILKDGYVYEKSDQIRHDLGAVLGTGLLFVTGKDHKRQRKAINPAFGPAQIRKFTETFIAKSNELRDIWSSLTERPVREDGWTRVDAFEWLNKAALDMIGLTGFNYNFDALHADGTHPNELYSAVNKSLGITGARSVWSRVLSYIPLFYALPTQESRARNAALGTITSIGARLIGEKKKEIMGEHPDGTLTKDDITGHDLLSLLLKSNMAGDLGQNYRMTDDEIISQVPTFIVAGHETTSTLVTWTLFALALAPDVQRKLREELRMHPYDSPSLEELNGIHYLESVLREALRLYAPVNFGTRVAQQDDVIPFETPFIDKYGVPRTELRVTKGDTIVIPTRILNRSKEIWGDDANEFKPERWDHLPQKTGSMPGVYNHLLTFLAGPHACIGFRFALAEAKSLLFSLVSSFEFALAMQPDDIVRHFNIVGRPFLDGVQSRPQLPLLIRPAKEV
ncbi:cytochrome P450 [Peniophora sp. CONT]|nr:cytochrome P450 [Peniophora sp. CONT]